MIFTARKLSNQTIELAARVAVEFYLDKKWLGQYHAVKDGSLERLSNGKRWSQPVLIDGHRAYLVTSTVYDQAARPRPFKFSHRLEYSRPR